MDYLSKELSRIVAIMVMTCVLSSTFVNTWADDGLHMLQKQSKAFAALAKRSAPAVVSISVEKEVAARSHKQQSSNPFGLFDDPRIERFFNQPGMRRHPGTQQQEPRRKQTGFGSGFIISSDGYIMTNSHVVSDADKITVKTQDGKEHIAILIGADPKSDVAVIKIDGNAHSHLKLGQSSVLEVGEWVIAIGNPFGLTSTVTVGVVSGKGRSGVGVTDYEDFIQTDAAINQGNSGGPLLNLKGEVVGINTAIFSRSGGSVGIGFAIPIDMAKTIKDQLVATGTVTRGYLGVGIQEIDADMAELLGLGDEKGCIVPSVEPSSAADKAGIEEGDVVISYNGKKIKTMAKFRNYIAALTPGEKVDLRIVRGGDRVDITVTVGTHPDSKAVAGKAVKRSEGQGLGLSLQDLTAELAQRFEHEGQQGAIISTVTQGSLADEKGLKSGMLIKSLNNKQVTDAGQFGKLLREVRHTDKKSILLLVAHKGRAIYIVLPLK